MISRTLWVSCKAVTQRDFLRWFDMISGQLTWPARALYDDKRAYLKRAYISILLACDLGWLIRSSAILRAKTSGHNTVKGLQLPAKTLCNGIKKQQAPSQLNRRTKIHKRNARFTAFHLVSFRLSSSNSSLRRIR